MAAFRFEKLNVWNKAVDYADKIYEITENFPDTERFGLISQLRRAAVSISSNIAEGTSRSSNVDYARFIEIAYGSLMETVSQLHLANRRRMVNDQQLEELKDAADEIAKMLSGLRTSLRKKT